MRFKKLRYIKRVFHAVYRANICFDRTYEIMWLDKSESKSKYTGAWIFPGRGYKLPRRYKKL